MFKTIQRIHFVGIGGSGMSGIAEVLINLGYSVSGSDMKETAVTQRLSKLGAQIVYGHRAENVSAAQVVVTSTAVQKDNPEVVQAHQNKVPVIPRIEMLAEIARLKYTIALAGTHGKTTVTSMTALLLQAAGLDPTFIVGGKIHHLQTGAHLGEGEFLVAEADESDGSFLKLSPTIAVITNIDNDHLDYHKTMPKLRKAFVDFGNKIPFYGTTIVCLDDAGVRRILPKLRRRVLTYGFHRKSDLRAVLIEAGSAGSVFDLFWQGTMLGRLHLKVSGRHNILNSMAAVLCGLELKIEFAIIKKSIEDFQSVARRLEVKAQTQNAVWIDDYGHHPTEVKAVLSALKERYSDKKIAVVFQPHRYSRTSLLMKDFAVAFAQADQLFLLPIYSAGELPIEGVSSQVLAQSVKENGVDACLFEENQDRLKQLLQESTVFLTLGAGDVWKVGEKFWQEAVVSQPVSAV